MVLPLCWKMLTASICKHTSAFSHLNLKIVHLTCMCKYYNLSHANWAFSHTRVHYGDVCLQLIYLCNNCTWKIGTAMPLFCISTLTPNTVPAAIAGWELSPSLQYVLCDREQGKLFLRGQGQEDTWLRAVLPVLPGVQFSVCFFHLWPFFCIDGEMKKHSLGYQRDVAEHLVF